MRTRLLGLVLASLAVLPMLAPLVWERGLPRFGAATDVAFAALTPVEQPLTVRAFAGQWELLLVIVWFALAYRRRRAPLWQVVLVLVGAGVGVVRLGNLWLTALLYVPALASQLLGAGAWLGPTRRSSALVAGVAGGLSLVTVGSVVGSRPAGLPVEAAHAAVAEPGQAAVFTSWGWAPQLQAELRSTRPVVGANGLSPEDAMDYLRVSLANAGWEAVLRQHGVGLVVLDTQAQAETARQMRQSADWRVTFEGDGVLVARLVGR